MRAFGRDFHAWTRRSSSTDTSLEDLSTQLREGTNRLVVQRLRVAVWVVAAVVVVFALSDLKIDRQHIPILYPVKLVHIAVLLGTYAALRRPRMVKMAAPCGLLVVSVSCLVAATSGVLIDDSTTTPILVSVLVTATAVVLPWGPWLQLAAVAVGALTIVWNLIMVTGGIAPLIGYHGVAVVVAFGASLYVAIEHRGNVELREVVRRNEFSNKLIKSSMEGILAFDEHCRLTVWNLSMERLSGIRSAEALGKCVFDVLPFLKEIGEDQCFFETLRGKAVVSTDRPYVIPGSARRRYLESHYAPLVNELGESIGGLAIVRDVSERKHAERELFRMNRALKTLSEGNTALVRATEESQLLGDICRVIVEAGGYRFAWVGYAEQDEERTVRPVAQAGAEAGYLTAVKVSWADTELGHGPVGTAIRTNAACVVKNVLTENSFQPWRAEASVRGHASIIAIPLRSDGQAFGALGIYAPEPDAFDAEEVRLLTELADDLAYGIGALRTRVQRLRAEAQQREEAQISAALVRVGREMISSLDTTVLLERLCQVTSEILECESSCTLLRQPEDEMWTAIAGYGFESEHWESVRVLKLPSTLFAGVLARLEHDDVLQAVLAESPHPIVPLLSQQLHIGVVLYMALRRGGRLIGLHAACHAEPHKVFSSRQERIARGISGLGSMALTNARLVEELEVASRLKSEFLTTISHELRTPLNAIISYNDMLREGECGPLAAEQLKMLEQMRRSSSDLLDLVVATLDLSRLERGEDPVREETVRLSDLLNQVEADAGPWHEKAGVCLHWTVEPRALVFRTDPVKLKIILKNLLANAFKFTTRGDVRVAVREAGGGLELAVTDTGIGIAQEHHTIIFEPFRQAEPYMTRRYGGVGLGLYIVRRLLDILGGWVAVDSAPDRGSTFRVWLPPMTPAPTGGELEAYVVGSQGCRELTQADL